MKTQKAMVIYGSPRGERSSSAVFGQALVRGLKRAGTAVNEVRLAGRMINPCTGCYTCWTKTPGQCIFKDDMTALLPEIPAADLMVHVFPLYYSAMPGIMKNFQDRTLPLNKPELVERNGITSHPDRFGPEPPVFLVCAAGFPEAGHFDALKALYRQVYGDRFLGSVLVGGAEMARDESYRQAYEPILLLAEQAGFELGSSGALDSGTVRALAEEADKSPESVEAFRETANAWWKSFQPTLTGSVSVPDGSVLCKLSDGGMSCFMAGMATAYNPAAQPDLAGIIQFRFGTGRYFFRIAGGKCLPFKGEATESLLAVTCTEELWYAISDGSVSGEAAAMDGRLKVEGELGILMRLDKLFGSGGSDGSTGSGGSVGDSSGSGGSPAPQKKPAVIPDHRGPIKLPGMVWFNIAFLPWIIFWAGDPLLGFTASRLAAAGAALIIFLYHRLTNRPTLFETGGLFYTLASAAAAWFLPGFLKTAAPVFDQLFMAGLWLGSLAGSFSLTAEYSRLGFPRPVWKQPAFLKTNDILVFVWGLYYIAATAAGTIGLMFPAIAQTLKIAGYIALAPMFAFTVWFSGWYPMNCRTRYHETSRFGNDLETGRRGEAGQA